MSGGKKLNKTKADRLFLNIFTRREVVFLSTCLFLVLLTMLILAMTFLPAERSVQKIIIADRVFDEANLIKPPEAIKPYVEINTPLSARMGDASEIKAQLNMAGLTAPAGENMVAEFYLDMDGSQTSPDGNILYPILGEYPAEAQWQIIPFNNGSLDGTLWIHLQMVISGEDKRQFLIMAYPFSVESTNFAGASAGLVRVICIIIGVLCFIMVLSFTIHAWAMNIKRNRIKHNNVKVP
ncbi:MAG: hypothetical protein LWX83_13685 [Anaerolineae bacterium]|nr:hypothetical protein [Anaerolineae bacterium]